MEKHESHRDPLIGRPYEILWLAKSSGYQMNNACEVQRGDLFLLQETSKLRLAW